MNILFLTPAFPPFPGGGERYAFGLAKELIRRGHTITVLTSSAETENHFWQTADQPPVVTIKDQPNFRIIRCPVRPFVGGHPALLIWRKMMVLISLLPGDQTKLLMKMAARIPAIPDMAATLDSLEGNFNLVQVFNLSWEYPMTLGWAYAQRNRLPLVVIPYTHLGVEGQDRVARNSTMDHQMKILAGADGVLTLTTIEEAGLVKLGVGAERVMTIHGGLEQPSQKPEPIDILERFNLSKPFALFLGRASYDKGAVHSAEAICRYNLNPQNVPLTLVLAGQNTPEFDRFYEKLGPVQSEWIQPIGLISESEKQALLADAEMLLLPSRTDSFGIVLLEAWVQGTAVIGARAGGIPGVVDDGRNGLLVEFGDVAGLVRAIERLMQDPKLKGDLGQAGLEKVNEVYRWEKVGERVEAVYRRLTSA